MKSSLLLKHSGKFFKTAGLVFEVRSGFPISETTFDPKLLLFEVEQPEISRSEINRPDINRLKTKPVIIEHHFSIPETFKHLTDKSAVSARPMWTIFKTDRGWIYKKHPALPVSDSETVYFEFDDNFSICRSFSQFLTPKAYAAGRFTSLTLFGCDQALVTNLLTHVKGLLIHANAIVHNGNGFLLAGTSGSGKSTLTQMMEKEGFQVVADDRMIIKMEPNHDAVMHGSWFHGTTPTISKGRHHLTSIFFLEQANENKIIPIEHPQEKISKLLQSVVRPHIQADAWNNLLDTVEELILSIDCYRLKFDLSGDIILSIKNTFRNRSKIT